MSELLELTNVPLTTDRRYQIADFVQEEIFNILQDHREEDGYNIQSAVLESIRNYDTFGNINSDKVREAILDGVDTLFIGEEILGRFEERILEDAAEHENWE